MPSAQPTAEEAGRVETNAPMLGECELGRNHGEEILAAMFLAKGMLEGASLDSIERMSSSHDGQIGLMAEIAGVARDLAAWACQHVDFAAFGSVWLYDVVEERLGPMLVRYADENMGLLLSRDALPEMFRHAVIAAGDATALKPIHEGGMKP